MRSILAVLVLALVAALAIACDPTWREPQADEPASRDAPVAASPSAPEAPPRSIDDGRALVAKHECSRCHEGTGLWRAPDDKHCFGCHDDIAAGRFIAPPNTLQKWRPRVKPLRHVPSLSRVGSLLDPTWVASFLERPFDLRPALHPEMPRLDLGPGEADAIARYLASLRGPGESHASEPSGPRGDADRGRALFSRMKCGSCHAFSGSGFAPPAPLPEASPTSTTEGPEEAARALAPDLAFARKRLRRDRVAAWIRAPRSVAPDATMPAQDVDGREANDLVAFLFDAPLAPPAPRMPPARLPLLERPVKYDEVAEKVLHKICWHCHAQPDFARGDGGPGNTGGFGFAGRGLDLSSYEAIAGGYRDASGKPTSLFAPAPSGEPVLLAVLLAREEEERGRVADVRGMPLGLPPISPEDIQLVASWVAQGHPR